MLFEGGCQALTNDIAHTNFKVAVARVDNLSDLLSLCTMSDITILGNVLWHSDPGIPANMFVVDTTAKTVTVEITEE